jgi:hypothetical protein
MVCRPLYFHLHCCVQTFIFKMACQSRCIKQPTFFYTFHNFQCPSYIFQDFIFIFGNPFKVVRSRFHSIILSTVSVMSGDMDYMTNVVIELGSAPISYSESSDLKSQFRDQLAIMNPPPQFLRASASIVPQIRPWSLPSTSFPIHYSLIILSFNV